MNAWERSESFFSWIITDLKNSPKNANGEINPLLRYGLPSTTPLTGGWLRSVWVNVQPLELVSRGKKLDLEVNGRFQPLLVSSLRHPLYSRGEGGRGGGEEGGREGGREGGEEERGE